MKSNDGLMYLDQWYLPRSDRGWAAADVLPAAFDRVCVPPAVRIGESTRGMKFSGASSIFAYGGGGLGGGGGGLGLVSF